MYKLILANIYTFYTTKSIYREKCSTSRKLDYNLDMARYDNYITIKMAFTDLNKTITQSHL